ncbi:IS66 family transposase [Waterburya agarophytonicola K14]|uniref:IS66 family transposase n=1 Tax=Waterburya agarophytonicola KI4 TaxID=2874699 RepID=A0A964BZB5_9CYAN|nr:IS66 family transposase [Waterburya agarophytonicola]MCC0179461.1 IS66 family transposase [Waterburya agarophytonicola KI4]
MVRLSKEDLAQMNRDYFQSLEKEKLVEVANNLHLLAVEQWDKINSDSSNSSQPPSSDNPFENPKNSEKLHQKSSFQEKLKKESKPKRKPGKQKGSKGFGRSQILKINEIIPHYPSLCSACNQSSQISNSKPYMGHQVLELEKTDQGLKIVCQLHHYYQATCNCGHQTKSKPGVGITSRVEGRTRDLKLTEYVLVGSSLATLIASLGIRYRLSRAKILEFLFDWLGVELSIGTIDRCVREAGIACEPVVEELLAQIQVAEILHIDETPWYQKGRLYWLWVAINSQTAVFRIAPRTKEEFKHLVTEAFVGWLITDGYGAYRHRERRQRCLAHLIRKAIGIAESINSRTARIGSLILEDLRDFIYAIKSGKNRAELDLIIRSLQGICHVGKRVKHTKLKALAKEILNDWDAVIAAVNNPDLPLTNNEAERALRHAVIARRISHGTRTNEGSTAYSCLLSVIETCRLRQVNPWTYIANVIRLARQGLSPPAIASMAI